MIKEFDGGIDDDDDGDSGGGSIHSKSWIRWIPESADNLEFSAERLSENAKNINTATC